MSREDKDEENDNDQESIEDNNEDDSDYDESDSGEEENDDIESDENEFHVEPVRTYDQEVLCKDNLESEDALQNGKLFFLF